MEAYFDDLCVNKLLFIAKRIFHFMITEKYHEIKIN